MPGANKVADLDEQSIHQEVFHNVRRQGKGDKDIVRNTRPAEWKDARARATKEEVQHTQVQDAEHFG